MLPFLLCLIKEQPGPSLCGIAVHYYKAVDDLTMCWSAEEAPTVESQIRGSSFNHTLTTSTSMRFLGTLIPSTLPAELPVQDLPGRCKVIRAIDLTWNSFDRALPCVKGGSQFIYVQSVDMHMTKTVCEWVQWFQVATFGSCRWSDLVDLSGLGPGICDYVCSNLPQTQVERLNYRSILILST